MTRQREPSSDEELKLLHTLLEHMPDRIYAMDREGRYVFDNRAHRRFLGVDSIEGIVGKTVYDFFPKELADEYRADDHAVLTSGAPLLNREEPINAADGQRKWVSTTKVPQYDEDGGIRGLVVISRDITDTKLAHDVIQAGKRRLEEDLVVAGETQAALFPSEYPEIAGSGAHLQFSHYHQFSHSLGGDYFTLVPFSPARVGVFICDVMGHGVQSALVAAMIHAQFHEVARDDPPPDVLLRRLNQRMRLLVERGRSVVFATALYVVMDLDHMRLSYALAGHPDPIHVCRRRGRAQYLVPPTRSHGPALGLFTGPTYRAHEVKIEPGQSILMFTDGLIEMIGPEYKLYGTDRLLSVAEDCQAAPGDEMLRRILDDVRRFACGEPAEDDVCLLAVDVVPGHALRRSH